MTVMAVDSWQMSGGVWDRRKQPGPWLVCVSHRSWPPGPLACIRLRAPMRRR